MVFGLTPHGRCPIKICLNDMLKILFYTIDGLGLGHIIRSINIASQIENLTDAKISFATNTPFLDIFKQYNFEVYKGGADPSLMHEGKITQNDYLRINEDFVITLLEKLGPDIFISDLQVVPMLKLSAYLKNNNIFSTYVLREVGNLPYLLDLKKYLKDCDRVLLTGVQKSNFMAFFAKLGLKKDKVAYVGNIFREPSACLIPDIRLKYKKKKNDLFVLIVAGGGGFRNETVNFFIKISVMIERMKQSLNTHRHQVRFILIKGPLFSGPIKKISKKIEVYPYEPNLPELFAISDLVISTGGYNSVNEIIASETPAIIFPFHRTKIDDQVERAEFYKKSGFIKVLNINDLYGSIKIIKNTLKIDELKKMRASYLGFRQKNGSRKAASIIINDYLIRSRRSQRLGVLRLRIDPIGEHFIYEELKNLLFFDPLVLGNEIEGDSKDLEGIFIQPSVLVTKKNMTLPVFTKDSIENFSAISQQKNIRLFYSEFLTDTISYLPLIQRLRKPLIVNVRGYEFSDPRTARYLPLISKLAETFIVKSDFQKNELIKHGIKGEKVALVYGGIDIEKIPFRFRKIDKSNLKLISVGRFVEKKGFDTILEFFEKWHTKNPNSSLTLIGQGNLDKEISSFINRAGISGNVTIKPFMRHDLYIEELHKHDIFILPSRLSSAGDHEGIPNVLKEAMTTGMPVISTRHGGIPELIKDEETGFLVNERDASGIIERMKWILDNKNKTLEICLNARFYVEKKFNITENAGRLEAIFKKAILPDYVNSISRVLANDKPLKFRVDLHLSSGCNGKCVMCDNWKNKRYSKLSEEHITSLLDNLKSFGVDQIRFHGQEPTLRKDLFSIMNKAKKMGFRIGLKTNALSCNKPKTLKFFNGHLDDLYLSIDSPYPEIHNKLRGNNKSFSKNILLAKSIKKHSPKTNIFINAVITKLNFSTLDGLIQLGSELGVSKVSFVHLNTKNKKNIKKLKLTKSQLRDFYFKIYPEILAKGKKFKINVGVDPTLTGLLDLTTEQQIDFLKNKPQKLDHEIINFHRGLYGLKFYSENQCYGVLDHATIDWEGNVFACCAMPRDNGLSVGNIRNTDFNTLWDSQRYREYREEILSGRCRFKNECARNFKQTRFINRGFRGSVVESANSERGILEEYQNIFKHNDYVYRYKMVLMVYYAFLKCRFYRNKFNDFIKLDKKIDTVNLPLTKKHELKNVFHGREAISEDSVEDYAVFKTSSCGSNAFLYARDPENKRFARMAASFVNTGGWKPGEPWLKLTSLNCLETGYPLKNGSDNFKNYESRCGDEIIIPPSENYLEDPKENILRIYNLIKKSGARLIHANPSYLKLLLHRFWTEGLTLDQEFIVHSTYELLLPSTRRIIEKYLACKIFDQYGTSEVGPIAHTCKNGKFHVFSDSVYVETLTCSDLKRKDAGRIVITDLENKVMPFVRYLTGDISSLDISKNCNCDLNTPVLGDILGREDEVLMIGDKVIFPREIDKLFSGIENILSYQISANQDNISVKLLPAVKTEPVDSCLLEKSLRSVFKNKEIKISICERILPSHRGKFRTIVKDE